MKEGKGAYAVGGAPRSYTVAGISRPWVFGDGRGTSGDSALGRVSLNVLRDDPELLKQFSSNESFHRWLTDTESALAYEKQGG